jgi:opacity protein-like surface antigen
MMKRSVTTAALALVLAGGAARDANAQVYLTPFGGVTFGDDAPETKFTAGAGLTFMGGIAGFEVDFGYTPDFFGEETEFALIGDSNVTTFSGSLVIGPSIEGRVRPYGVAGLGIVRSRISDAEDLFDDLTTNDLAFNVGGGVIAMISDRVGIRGDVRYFRALQDDEDDDDLDVEIGRFGFWRATAGVTFRF